SLNRNPGPISARDRRWTGQKSAGSPDMPKRNSSFDRDAAPLRAQLITCQATECGASAVCCTWSTIEGALDAETNAAVVASASSSSKDASPGKVWGATCDLSRTPAGRDRPDCSRQLRAARQ